MYAIMYHRVKSKPNGHCKMAKQKENAATNFLVTKNQKKKIHAKEFF